MEFSVDAGKDKMRAPEGQEGRCPHWTKRLLSGDAATLRLSVIIGCAACWGVVILLALR
ncbi:MAG: hypothetical protein JJU09_07645 [Rhodobacteraceae bacterium]|nr:hypothetical protein [Paracoccaceae bacterium]